VAGVLEDYFVHWPSRSHTLPQLQIWHSCAKLIFFPKDEVWLIPIFENISKGSFILV
jgi:hypothetical protein